MCFNVTDDQIKKAKSPIKAWKLFVVTKEGVIKSPFRNSIWKPGVKKTSRLKMLSGMNEIHLGIHCFKTKRAALVYPHRELHHVLKNVVIPEGASYYVNSTQYVTNALSIEIPAPKKVIAKKVAVKKTAVKKKK